MIQTIEEGKFVAVRRTRIIHAGPTCGKTVLLSTLNNATVICIDTDDLVKEASRRVYDTFFYQHRDLKDEVISELKDRLAGLEVSRVLASRKCKLVITNLWSKAFMSGIHKSLLTADGKIGVSFFRSNPERITELASLRQGGKHKLSLALTKKWLEAWSHYGDNAFARQYALEDDQFLGNVLDLSKLEDLPVSVLLFDGVGEGPYHG